MDTAFPTKIEVMERVLTFETDIILHEQIRDAVEKLDDIRTRSKVPEIESAKGRGLLVVGDSGAGKTTVVEEFLLSAGYQKDPVAGEDGDRMPILHIDMPSSPTRRQVVKAIMNELGYPVRDEWNTAHILDQISYLCEQMGVEIIVIDEAHHIMDAKGDGEEEISEFLKSLLNACKCQFALFGLPTLLRLRGYAQLKRRFQPPVVLVPYHWDMTSGRSEFLAVLDEFETGMDLPEPSNLSEQWNALRLYCATGGHIGLVSKYLSEAYRRALTEGLPCIDMELLAEVYDDFERGTEQAPVSKDYLADPIDDARMIDAATNPFLADRESFDKLWEIMSSKRVTMGLMSKPRKVEKTRFKGTAKAVRAFKE
ncbi:TniB family NTP-binding protein [Aureimonas sp. AU22]|uniref:TniB family NTP-binding protein n=1 Tax=Aureimonas sp. AU22 TaxID=1638162 RepID=UPI0007845E54|nr:TniB family NTP-binding protein [Aureimonas sp. AU22]